MHFAAWKCCMFVCACVRACMIVALWYFPIFWLHGECSVVIQYGIQLKHPLCSGDAFHAKHYLKCILLVVLAPFVYALIPISFCNVLIWFQLNFNIEAMWKSSNKCQTSHLACVLCVFKQIIILLFVFWWKTSAYIVAESVVDIAVQSIDWREKFGMCSFWISLSTRSKYDSCHHRTCV